MRFIPPTFPRFTLKPIKDITFYFLLMSNLSLHFISLSSASEKNKGQQNPSSLEDMEISEDGRINLLAAMVPVNSPAGLVRNPSMTENKDMGEEPTDSSSSSSPLSAGKSVLTHYDSFNSSRDLIEKLKYEDGYDSEEEKTWEYAPKQYPPSTNVTQDPIAIPFFRGVHLFKDKFSSMSDRVKFLQTSQVGSPVFSSAPFKMLGLNYWDQNHSTIDFLTQAAKTVKSRIKELKEKPPMQIRSKTVDPHTAFHYQYVNSYSKFISNLGEFSKLFDGKFEFLGNPLVSVAETPDHPLLYAFGVKIDESNALRPCFDKDGKPKNPYLGKIYIMLFPLKKTREDKIFRVVEAAANGEMPVNHRIKHEIEAAVPGMIGGKYVIYEQVVRVPNFKHQWDPKHERKYGLRKRVYNSIKKGITDTKGDYQAQECVYKNLIHHIIHNHYNPTDTCWAKQLHQLAQQEASKQGFQAKHLDLHRLPAQIPMKVGGEITGAEINLNHYQDILGDVLLRASTVNEFNRKGAAPLHRVCENDRLGEDVAYRLIEYLLNKNAEVNLVHKKSGKMPLHIAASFNKTRLITLLVKRKAQVDGLTTTDAATPLILASSFHGNVEAIQLLVALGADPNAITREDPRQTCGGRMTALHFACQEGLVNNVAALIESGANPKLRTKNGMNVHYFLENASLCKKITQETCAEISRLLKEGNRGVKLQSSQLVEPDNPLYDFIAEENLFKIKEALTKGNLTQCQLKLGFEGALQQESFNIVALFKGKLSKEDAIPIIEKEIRNVSQLIDNAKLEIEMLDNDVQSIDMSHGDSADRAQAYQHKQMLLSINGPKKLDIHGRIKMLLEVISRLNQIKNNWQ